MPSLFDQVFETFAAPMFDEHWFAVDVQLKRGAITSPTFSASWAGQEYNSLDEKTGLPIVVKKRVYRFLKTDLTLSGSVAEPIQGDILVDGDDELTLLPVDGKPAVQSEPGDYRWLVRTNKLV